MKKFVIELVSFFFRLFTSVRPKRILFWANKGASYCCNPKYFTEYLINYQRGKYDIVWAFNQDAIIGDVPDSVKIIRKSFADGRIPTLSFLYYLNTSSFIITNFRNYSELVHKRKGQYMIFTWHANYGFKPIEKDYYVPCKKKEIRYYERCNDVVDLMLSGTPLRTQEIRRAQGYEGEILEKGNPRNDIFFDTIHKKTYRNKVIEFLGIPIIRKVLLYAPTFRDHDTNDISIYSIEWDGVLNALKKRFGSDYVVLLRLHPNIRHLTQKLSIHTWSSSIIDVSDYPDMQELLLASDILITDYSSTPFDFCFTGRPCFLYTPDLIEYTTVDRAKLNFEMRDLPFPNSRDAKELINSILTFDEQKYQKELNVFLLRMNMFDNGMACESLYRWMENKVKNSPTE